ncbi:MAG TPA: hypothetical protein DCE18_09350, partial [Syntrophobacteraceae bacterium]|nr:hypothetical protein [Syntrophobacteraceae bacterium]
MVHVLQRFSRRLSLRIKTLGVIAVVVIIFTGASISQTITFLSRSGLELTATYNKSLLEHTYSAIRYPMAIGDSDIIVEQFDDIKQNMQGVEVYVTDFRQGITYASEKERTRSPMHQHLHQPEAKQALSDTLQSGQPPNATFTETNGANSYLISIKPVLNERSCHHCHGSSQKVLGAIVVKQPVTSIFAALGATRVRLLGFYAVEIIGIILLLNLLLSRLVTRRIRFLAEQTSRVSAGDVSVEVWDDAKDSIGALTRNFNQMIKGTRDRMEYANSLKLGIYDPFFMVDPDMKISYINKAAAQLAGLQPDAVRGKFCSEVFHTDTCDQDCPVRKALATGEASLGTRIVMTNTAGR